MNRLYQTLYDALPCAVVVVGRGDAEVRSINQQGADLFGYSAERLCGQSIEFLGSELHKEVNKTWASDYSVPLEVNCRCRDGSTRLVVFRFRSLEVGGEIMTVCVASTSRESTRPDHETLAAFFSRMGHEMRTPLNAILGYSEMHVEEPQAIDPDELTADLKKIIGAATRLMFTIDQVVDLAKSPTATRSDFDAEKVIAKVTAQLEDLAPRRGIKEVVGSGGADLLTGTRILLVEDHPLNQELASELLGEAGLVVTLAENGQEAVRLLDRQAFDCVLMDIHMPVMDGYEATRKIREQSHLAGMPVIAMTAGATDEDRLAALAAGMNDLIAKPFDIDQTIATLARWITSDSN